jgi:hypothetical protein
LIGVVFRTDIDNSIEYLDAAIHPLAVLVYTHRFNLLEEAIGTTEITVIDKTFPRKIFIDFPLNVGLKVLGFIDEMKSRSAEKQPSKIVNFTRFCLNRFDHQTIVFDDAKAFVSRHGKNSHDSQFRWLETTNTLG